MLIHLICAARPNFMKIAPLYHALKKEDWADADEILVREGISPDKIYCVGNIMIDSLEMLREKIENQDVYEEFQLQSKGYGLVTLNSIVAIVEN
jgi:UDP-N-acetylglucosamine 2-epimerase